MNGKHREEIEADLKRAEDSLKAAAQLIKDGYFDIAASRAYYAVFYALSALLLNEGLEFRKHSGVISTTHQKFIKTSKLPKHLGESLNWLFELRSVGDYGVTLHVSSAEARRSLRLARSLV